MTHRRAVAGQRLERVAARLARLVGLVLALLAAAAVVVLVVLPRATHGQAMTVLSGSMTPGIPVGSVAVVRPIDPAALQVGDIATYQSVPGKPVYVTHRIAAIDVVDGQTQFTFKGDANRGPDTKPVVAGQIRGELWFHVPYLGRVRDSLHTTAVRLVVIILVLGGYALTQIASGLRDQRSRPRAPQTRGTERVDA